MTRKPGQNRGAVSLSHIIHRAGFRLAPNLRSDLWCGFTERRKLVRRRGLVARGDTSSTFLVAHF